MNLRAVSSNQQKEYFLRKEIYNVKSNKTTFKEKYKLTKKEVDWNKKNMWQNI